MLWWMVGSTAFLQALSAMTFTGVMGKALDVGLSISVIFFANALGYFCNYLFFAARARQMRVTVQSKAFANVLVLLASKL